MENIPILLEQQTLYLSPLRGMFWANGRTLFVTDLHLSLESAMQKDTMSGDLLRLADLIHEFMPERLFILGDLFHNTYTGDCEFFGVWRQQFSELSIVLIKGNHDILPTEQYKALNISFIEDSYQEGRFFYTHKPQATPKANNTIFCGHVHPAIQMQRQNGKVDRLPCFYKGNGHFILPSFNLLSGMAEIHPDSPENIYAVSPNSIYKVL